MPLVARINVALSIMKKTLAVVLALFIVLTILDVAPVAAKKPLVMPLTPLKPMMSTRGEPQLSCPDGGTCSSNTTCCFDTSGQFLCCGHVTGNCCFDYTHCCASGYVCDLANSQCLKASIDLEDIPDKM